MNPAVSLSLLWLLMDGKKGHLWSQLSSPYYGHPRPLVPRHLIICHLLIHESLCTPIMHFHTLAISFPCHDRDSWVLMAGCGAVFVAVVVFIICWLSWITVPRSLVKYYSGCFCGGFTFLCNCTHAHTYSCHPIPENQS